VAEAPEPLQLFGTNFEGAQQTGPSGVEPATLQTVRRAGRLVIQAQERFRSAVLAARSEGCSWRQIGTAAGVPYQSLHRRLVHQPKSETPPRRRPG
jgi:DNA-directed RNA polymerase specialized sigma24 family protein